MRWLERRSRGAHRLEACHGSWHKWGCRRTETGALCAGSTSDIVYRHTDGLSFYFGTVHLRLSSLSVFFAVVYDKCHATKAGVMSLWVRQDSPRTCERSVRAENVIDVDVFCGMRQLFDQARLCVWLFVLAFILVNGQLWKSNGRKRFFRCIKNQEVSNASSTAVATPLTFLQRLKLDSAPCWLECVAVAIDV